MSWRHRAACIGQPIALFFQDRGRNDQTLKARALCRDCPVRLDCLDFAMSFPDKASPASTAASPKPNAEECGIHATPADYDAE